MATPARKTTPQPMPEQDILNIDGAAALLGVSVKTFSKVLRQGDVPGRKVGREWKFSRQALIDWIGNSRSRDFLDTDSEGGDGDGISESPRGRDPRPPRKKPSQDDGYSVDNL